MRHEAAILMKRIEDEAKDTAEKNAKDFNFSNTTLCNGTYS